MAANSDQLLGQLLKPETLADAGNRMQEQANSFAPRFEPITDTIALQTRTTPAAIAAVWEEDALSYLDLERHAGALARRLRALGVDSGSRVGLMVGRTPEMVIGALGILKSGAAYVPVDPDYPAERTAWILEDARVDAVVTLSAFRSSLPALSAPVVLLDDEAASTGATEIELPTPRAEDVAYVMYTSGTSGRPKGVMVTHGNLAHYATALGNPLGVSSADRYLHTASIAFSSSIRQMILPLTHGATVVIADRDRIRDPLALFAYIQAMGVTVIDLVPSYARLSIETLRKLDDDRRAELLRNDLRLIVSASEPLPPEVPQTWEAWFGSRVQLLNMYGQTETTGIIAVHRITGSAREGGPVTPIGIPIANTRLYLLDEQGVPAAIGDVGEIYVAGEGVAVGYLNQPELSAQAFLPDPFAPNGNGNGHARMYRTGDRGRRRIDGTVEFVGRQDRQVKIRGHRVELEEVEAALRIDASIEECVVAARANEFGDARLVAYIASSKGEIEVLWLLERLRGRLAPYMVPSHIVQLPKLPRLPNGKVDHRALPDPEIRVRASAAEFVAPQTPAEELLAEVWSAVLGNVTVGRNDNFFDLGGDSLLAMRVAARVRDAVGVDLPHGALFQAPTVSELAAAIERLRGDTRATSSVTLVRAPEGEPLPLSFAQERLWVLHQMQPDNVAYHLTAGMRLKGALSGRALAKALTEIVRRHTAFRTAFPSARDGAIQEILPPAPVPLPVVDLELFEESECEAEAFRLATEEARRPFDLARGPLFRAMLLRLASDDHILVITFHHMIADGWSRGILYRELSHLYSAYRQSLDPTLPEPTIRAADVARWQRLSMEQDPIESLAFWREYLGAHPAILELPTDRPRPPMQSFRGATRTFEVPAELVRRLRDVSRVENATLYMTLLGAFNVLLHRYTGQRELLVGSPVAARTRTELEEVIGFLANTVAIRTDIEGDPTFRDLLATVRGSTLAAYAHQHVPFERIVDALQVPRDLSRSPVFQVMFILQKELQQVELEGLSVESIDLDTGSAKFDLTLSLASHGDGLKGSLEYATDIFDAATIDRLAGHFVTLLAAIADNATSPISTLPLLTEREHTQLVREWNDTETSFDADAHCIHELFAEQVRRTPNAVAVVHKGRELTYAQLDEKTNQVASRLRAMGVGPNSMVGVFMERSLEMVVGLFGIHKAGGAYVPLDPAFPAERLAYMVEDSGVRVILTQPQLSEKLPEHTAEVLVLDAQLCAVAGESTAAIESGATPENLAYVIYTSGSTGRPKGVMVQHRNVANFFVGMDERIGAEPGTWLAVTSISFDISVLELFWTLTRGFKVVVQGDDPSSKMGIAAAFAAPKRKIDFSLFYFAGNGASAGGDRYRLLMEGAKFADRNGFEAVWTPERHFHAFGGLYPNPSITSAAVAAVTERIKLRAGSVVLPLHSPIRVAEEWSVVDNISNGRVGIALASGWHDRDFAFAPDNYARRREVMVEQLETLRKLWRGESIKTMGGAGKEVEISTLPRPIQPELPIWLTAAGAPDTFKRAGELGCHVLTHLLGQSIEQVREKLTAYRDAWREAGHPGEGHVTLMMHTFVGQDAAAVREQVYHPFREYLRTSVDLISKLAEGRGQDMRSASFTKEDMEVLLDHAFERYYQTSALLGTVDSCEPMVDKLRDLGVDEIACLIDFGIDENEVLKALTNLAELRQRCVPADGEDTADYSLPAQIARHQVTHLQCTPSMASVLLAQPEVRQSLGNLRTIMLGGEALPQSLAAELKAVTPATILNMYGPTETTIWSSTHTVNGGAISIGTPIANTTFFVLDPNLKLVPIGVPGELFIGGDGVVPGYLNRPELTTERFIPNPFGAGRLYRTGDRVRWEERGSIDFLGRVDFQVKIRGHRIEPGEVEAVLNEHPTVREGVVLAREDVPGDRRLVGYMTAEPGQSVDPILVRKWMKERLPEYMVPDHLVVLADMPRTPNAKIDRKALPAPDQVVEDVTGAATATETGTAEGENALEARITEVWKEVLRVPRVGRQDNFFDIGGNSLLTVKLHIKLAEALSCNVSLTDLFRFPTIKALAEHLGNGHVNGNGASKPEASVEVEIGTERAAMRKQAAARRRQLRG